MKPAWMDYRAPCRPFETGCRQCGKDIPARRANCSASCADVFEHNHFWNTARAEAIRRASPFGPAPECVRQPWIGWPVCSRCRQGTLSPEVNHRVPLNRRRGRTYHFGCFNHQENLEVVCHDCHVQIGIEQRAAGLIGKPKPPAEAARVVAAQPDLFAEAAT